MLQATALHDPLYLGRLIAIYHDDAVQSFAPMGGFDQQGQFVQDEVFALALCRGRQGQGLLQDDGMNNGFQLAFYCRITKSPLAHDIAQHGTISSNHRIAKSGANLSHGCAIGTGAGACQLVGINE